MSIRDRVYPHFYPHQGQNRGCWANKKEGILPSLMLEPVVGVEPTTCCLRNSCSATELHRHRLLLNVDLL